VQNESARGIYDLVHRHGLALGNAILTVENEEQALARADKTRKNKGGEAAAVALTMLDLKRKLQ
jgi:6,7-dimethyl-8-ribityllumazine synthase